MIPKKSKSKSRTEIDLKKMRDFFLFEKTGMAKLDKSKPFCKGNKNYDLITVNFGI